jgi:hypothetical protein
MLNVGWWIHSEFKIAHSKFRSLCGGFVSNRSFFDRITKLTGLAGLGQEEIQSSVLPRSLPLILPYGLPLAGCPASTRWPVFRGED